MKLKTNIIYNEDCLSGLKKIPDNSIDLIVTDPLYNICKGGGGGAFGTSTKKYLKKIMNSNLSKSYNYNLIFTHFIRIMKKINLYIFCNKNQILDILLFFKNYNIDILVFHKKNPIPTINNKYLSDLEYIIFIREKGAFLGGNYKSKSKLYSKNIIKNNLGHPTIKPLPLIKKLITNSSRKGDIVLDSFMGSGTTAIACIDLDRKYIGFEIEKEYIKLSDTRIKQTLLQKKLSGWFEK